MNQQEYINFINILMHDDSLYVPLPDNIALALSFSNDCNCHCKFCSEGDSITRDRTHREIVPEKWLYEYMLPLYEKTSILVPTYGDIVACKEGYDYLSFINDNYYHINILAETNGIAFNERWANLAIENLMRVHFSINAINEEYFKKTVWDKDGIYTIVQKNFNRYLELLKENDLFEFKPYVSCVINSDNYETVREFVKDYVSRGIQIIYLYFDMTRNGLKNFKEETEETKNIILTILELERVLSGKVFISHHRLFAPTNNIEKFDAIVQNTDLGYLKKKYSDIIELTKNLPTIKELHEKREQKRKEKGKKSLTISEELTGTYSPYFENNIALCGMAFNGINIKPSGKFSACCVIPTHDNIQNYIKKDKIDWNELFNSPYYRILRYNFRHGNYIDCLQNCPGNKNMTKEEYYSTFLKNFS